MPIENLSSRVKIPRLGKIHLGVKAVTDKSGHPVEYPKAVDYFVVPDEVKAVYGDQPKKLDIMFPVEDPEQFAPQFLKAYSLTQGLICRGDGVRAHRKIDVNTGEIATSKTTMWEWHDISCNPQECNEYSKKSCKQVLNLLFLLPEVPGLGAWQIDTSSYNSIVNINSMIKVLKGMLGRCSMIPLTLVLKPQEVSPPGIKKKTVYVLDIRQDVKLADLAKKALLPVAQVLLPEVGEEIPEDLYPISKLAETESTKETPPETTPAKEKKAPPQKEEPPTVPPEKAPPAEEKEIPLEKALPPEMDKLIQRIHIEAKNVSEDYYDTVIRPRIKVTFNVDSSKELDATQLNVVLDWMTASVTDQDKRAFVLKMRDLGCKTKEDVINKIVAATGKDRGWTCADFNKTIIQTRKAQKPPEESQEIDEFLQSETQQLL